MSAVLAGTEFTANGCRWRVVRFVRGRREAVCLPLTPPPRWMLRFAEPDGSVVWFMDRLEAALCRQPTGPAPSPASPAPRGEP